MSVIKTKTIEIKKGKNFTANIEIFNSTLELVKTCKTRTITNSSFDNMKEKSLDTDFHGVKNYEEALTLMYDGWSKEVEPLKATMKSCVQSQTQKRVSFRNDIQGFAPIVPLAIMGIPNSMINSACKSIKTKVISIYYDMGVSWSVSPRKILENGKRMVEAIVNLENSGYRVELNVVNGFCDCDNGDVIVTNVKSANQPLDLKRICFPSMHSAFFRVVCFDWYSKFPIGKYRSGLGYPIHRTFDREDLTKTMKKLFGDNSVYVSGGIIDGKDTDYIIKMLKGEERR